MNDNTKRMPETPGVYADRDGCLWVFLESFDGQLLGVDISTALELYCEEKIKLENKNLYKRFAPFTKIELLDIADTDKEKTEAKNMENTTPLPEDTTPVENVDPFEYRCTTLKGCRAGCSSMETEISATAQGLVIIRCNDCHRMICGDSINFYQFVKAWNKGSERP